MDKETAEYENGNLIKAYTGGSGTYEYTYDETYKHRVTAVDDGVVKQSYGYDSKGNITSTTLENVNGSTKLKTSASYTSDGNRVNTVTDANGNTVWNYYSTDLSKMTGAPTKISTALPGYKTVDANKVWLDTETAYDNFGRTTSMTVKEKNGNTTVANPATIGYTYSNGNLTNIERTASGASQNYVLGYDVWGNNTSISVGDLALATYTYAPENGNLLSMTYGNGDKVSYAYDKLGRVETVTYYTKSANAVTRVLTYTYNGEGQVHSVHDSATGETLHCVYDSLGRVISADNGDVRETYTYNSYNQLTKYRFVSLVLGDGTQTYTYDTNSANSRSDGMLTGMTMVSGHTVTYSYDALQRLTQRHINSGKTGGGMWDCYTYKDGSDTNTTTTQIHSKQNWLNNSIKSNFLFFEYDGVGNITKEVRHTYNIPEDSDTSQPGSDYTVSTVQYTYDNLN